MLMRGALVLCKTLVLKKLNFHYWKFLINFDYLLFEIYMYSLTYRLHPPFCGPF